MNKYSLLENIKYILKVVKEKDRILLAEMAGMGLISAFLPYIVPYLSKAAVSCIVNGTEFERFAIVVVLFTVIFIVLKTIYNTINLSLWWRFFALKNEFVISRLDKAMEMSFENLEKKDILDKMEKAENATQGNSGVEGMLYSIKDLGIYIVRILFSVTLITFLSPVAVIVVISLSAINYKIGQKTKQRDVKLLMDKKAPVDRKINYWSRVTSNFAYAKEIRLFRLKEWIFKEIRNNNQAALALERESKRNWLITNSISYVLGFFQQLLIYGFLIYRVYSGTIAIDDFVFYSGCIMVLFDTVGKILDTGSTLSKQSIEINCYREVIELDDPEQSKNDTKLDLPEENSFMLEVKNVSFRYDGQRDYALRDVNMQIDSKSKVAIVGKNGSGKSTLIKLFCRLYKPTDGEILLNGINIWEYELSTYLSVIAPVFQDINIFALSLKQNIDFGAGDDEERVNNAIAQAGLADKVRTLEQGIHSELLTIMSDQGVVLSGGEKQKLAIARSLYKKSRMVIMDEPTAALDPLAEQRLYQSLNEMIEDKTGVYISHRLSSTRFCDYIYLFDTGKIIEEGTHDELMICKGDYYDMFQLQAQYYV